MKIEVKMPKRGRSQKGGVIKKWLKKEGEKVDKDENLLDVLRGRTTVKMTAPDKGVVAEILFPVKENVPIGKVLAVIDTEAEPIKIEEVKKPEPDKKPKETGRKPANVSKKIKDVEKEPDSETEPEIKVEKDDRNASRPNDQKFYSPLVRSIAKKEGLAQSELDQIKGTGQKDRVTKADLLLYIERKKKAVTRPQPKPELKKSAKPMIMEPRSPVRQDRKSPSKPGSEEIIHIDRQDRMISGHMLGAKGAAHSATIVFEADLTGIVRFIESNNSAFSRSEGFGLSLVPFFASAAIKGVKKYPAINSSYDENSNELINHRRIDLGIADILPNRSMVNPVILNAENLNLTGLARAISDLGNRAKNVKLAPEELKGAAFTLADIGKRGALFGESAIMPPQTAVLGIGSVRKVPVVKTYNGEDAIVVRRMAYLSLTYDCRVVDGALAGDCLSAIIGYLESMNEETLSL